MFQYRNGKVQHALKWLIECRGRKSFNTVMVRYNVRRLCNPYGVATYDRMFQYRNGKVQRSKGIRIVGTR